MPEGKVFDFGHKGESTRQNIYPWGEWLDGTLWLLERSEGPANEKGTILPGTETTKRHYGVPTLHMVAKVKLAATKAYKIAQVSRYGPDGTKLADGFVMQARPMTPEERVEEDKQRRLVKHKGKAPVEEAAGPTAPETAPPAAQADPVPTPPEPDPAPPTPEPTPPAAEDNGGPAPAHKHGRKRVGAK